MRRWVRATRRAGSAARQRVTANLWPILQGTAAATVAWVLARHLIHHHQPFFAPIAAVVALNAARGERGTNAVRLLVGVILGIVVAEAGLAAGGPGYVTLAVTTFVAMLLALVLGGERIVIAQAAASAILTVATETTGAGTARLVDALLGTGVAIVASQLLFPAEPVALLRRSEVAALRDMADGLDITARALERDDKHLADAATDRLRDVRDRLTELGHTRASSARAARRAPLWWARSSMINQENENAGHLDLLGTSCLTLTRTAMTTAPAERAPLGPPVHELAGALSILAGAPGDRTTRQHAANRALEVVRTDVGDDAVADPHVEVVRAVIRMVAVDLMVFAALDQEQAAAAVDDDSHQPRVDTPAALPRLPLPRGRRKQQ